MANSAHFSLIAPVFNGITIPEEGYISGYTAIIYKLKLSISFPKPITVVNTKTRRSQTETFLILPNSYLVEDHLQLTEIEALYRHLVFALKYEGVNLLVFSALVKHYSENILAQLVSIEPTGIYSRRIWFLVEWLLGKELTEISSLTKKSYVDLIDTKLQYAINGTKSSRYLVTNNLPGTINFCPLIKKTPTLEKYLDANLSAKKNEYLKGIKKTVLQRASAFLLLKDSKASFTIEGESPRSKRAARWGQAIGQAGLNLLSHEEFERLQQIVIENPRFTEMGYRKQGGFVGEHDRSTGEPIPDHISAKHEDLNQLMEGLINTDQLLLESDFDGVLAAALIAFGFVFIHPFEDGNGRIHRYLIHHVLAKKHFSQQGMIFPVSASILDHIENYREVLEEYSSPLLDFIEWKETKNHNIEVLNETIDYYRYFDATKQAEFLYTIVKDTIDRIIPDEVDYLLKYDEFKTYIDNEFEMPDKKVALLVRFLEQNNGTLSNRAKEKEFSVLEKNEIKEIEKIYNSIFIGQ
ncbi:MAG: Fic family protein [Bacteroidetes bacterium]|nr:Fic family protein [Bacteroidota bacterium]